MNYYTILSSLRELSDRELDELTRAIVREQVSRRRRGMMVQLGLYEDEDGQQKVFENELIRSR